MVKSKPSEREDGIRKKEPMFDTAEIVFAEEGFSEVSKWVHATKNIVIGDSHSALRLLYTMQSLHVTCNTTAKL